MSKLRVDELESLSTGESILVDEIDSGVRADLANPDKGAAMVAYRHDKSILNKMQDIITASDLTEDIADVMAADLGAKRLLVLDGHKTYRADIFHRQNRSTVIGNGAVVEVGGGASPTMARIGNHSTVDGVVFISTEADRDNSRGTMEHTDGATYRNCSFQNFRAPSTMNGWGLYLKNTTNAHIENCTFGGNTTYDLTLVDEVHGVTVDNVSGLSGAGCKVVIEPNDAVDDRLSVDRVEIKNSKISYFSLMENSTPYVASQAEVKNSTIDELELWGGILHLSGNLVGQVTQRPRFMTQLRWDNLLVGANLLSGITPTQSGSQASPLVTFDGVPAYKCDPNYNGSIVTSYRVYTVPSLEAGRYVLTVEGADVTMEQTSESFIGLEVSTSAEPGVNLLPKLGNGGYTVGKTYRGKSSYIISHAGGALTINVGRIATQGRKTIAYIKGIALREIIDINSTVGNFNDAPLAVPT